jgi:hypothetical protein
MRRLLLVLIMASLLFMLPLAVAFIVHVWQRADAQLGDGWNPAEPGVFSRRRPTAAL